jgi:hypothetical protein
LTILNDVRISGVAINDVEQLKGSRLTEIDETPDELTLSFDNGASVIVDLRDRAFKGPEAMTLRVPGQPLIVWN